MAEQKYILSQVLEWVHRQTFSRCFDKYNGNYRVRNYSYWDQVKRIKNREVTDCFCFYLMIYAYLGIS